MKREQKIYIAQLFWWFCGVGFLFWHDWKLAIGAILFAVPLLEMALLRLKWGIRGCN